MTQRFSTEYIDKLLNGGEYSDLVTLSNIVSSSTMFKQKEPDYGLPPAAFLFVELLCWFAQANRSGVWTYYEATPKGRQLVMERMLRQLAPVDFSYWYSRGVTDWTDEEKIKEVDSWLEANNEMCEHWLRDLALANRGLFVGLGA